MSRHDLPALPVIEWSPSGVVLFEPASGKLLKGDTISTIRSKIAGDDVVVALSRRSSFIRTARLPDASKAEVRQILALQIGTLLPVSPTDAAVDFYLTEDRNADGRLAIVAAVKSDTLKLVLAELASVGLRARCIVPAALGSSMLSAELGMREGAVVHETTEGLAIDLIEDAELKAARVVPMPNPSDVAGEIARSFAASKMGPAGVIAAGGFAVAGAEVVEPRSPLALLSNVELPITLEPPDLVAKRLESRSKRFRRIAIWLWLATVMLGAVLFDQRLVLQQENAKGEVKWRKILTAKRATQSQAEAKFNEVRKVATALDLGFEPRQRLVDVVALVTTLTPEGLWVTGMTVERGKPATIRGTALSSEGVTRFLEQLSAQPRFRDVKLIFANNGQIEKTNVVQFSMTLHVIGNFSLDSESYTP